MKLRRRRRPQGAFDAWFISPENDEIEALNRIRRWYDAISTWEDI